MLTTERRDDIPEHTTVTGGVVVSLRHNKNTTKKGRAA